MRPTTLLREAWRTARAALVPTALVALVVAGTCVAAMLTVGRRAGAEATLAAQVAAPAARTLTVTVTGDADVLTPATLDLLIGMNGTEAVLGAALPVDAHNGVLGAGSPTVAVVQLDGDLDHAVHLTRGRLPGPGEVVVAESALATARLAAPVGYLQSADGRQWAVVGAFVPRAPFENLDGTAVGALDAGPNAAPAIRTLTVVVDSAAHVAAVQHATLAVLDADPAQLQVVSPLATTRTGQLAADTLAGLGRSLLALILAAGGFFVVAVVLADVLIRRRDLGRRRTLGITRGDLIGLVALRTLLPAATGALVGSVVGLVAVHLWHSPGAPTYALAVALLATLTALLASLPPAVYAARRDPVDVMRTP